MIIGRVLAWQLGAEVGDELTVMVPGTITACRRRQPVLQTFVVTGVFEVGLQDHDGSLALVALEDAAGLAGGEAGPAGLRLRFDDVMRRTAARRRAARGARRRGHHHATGRRSTRRISAPSASRRR